MSLKWLLIQHLSNTNKIIKHPLQSTQRIKFTCFDVSNNYIVFGATSGGLYVFNRYPVKFLKLIPCKHGSVTQIVISSNEKNVAIASNKGLVVLIPSCFGDCDVQYHVFTEHNGNIVTALKWHSNELYCGDSKGKITVIRMPNVLSKAILHAPCCSLMQLDSSIVQIDCHSFYLLISTHTRTYICNTEKEQFRQIGKQLREVSIGACFFATVPDAESEAATMLTRINSGLFKNMKDDDSFKSSQVNDNIKIFCGRPSARLWEVKLDGSVIHTHHVKNYLKNDHTSIVKLNDKPDTQTAIHDVPSSKHNEMKLLNFTKFYVMRRNFIFTFNSEGFYVFNPESSSVICWCNYFKGIKEAKLVGDLIYIWNEKDEIVLLAVNSLEKAVTKTLFEQKYKACAQLCIAYLDETLALVETSDKLHFTSILKEKLDDHSLLAGLSPLFKALEEFTEVKFVEQLTPGIKTVNNLYVNKNSGSASSERTSEELSVAKTSKGAIEKVSKNVKQASIGSTQRAATKEEKPKSNETPADWLKIFRQRYELSNINNKLEMSKFDYLLHKGTLNQALSLFKQFQDHMIAKGVAQDQIERWCYSQFLKHFSKREEFSEFDAGQEIDQFTLRAFCKLNYSPDNGCKCLYPLPSAKTKPPEYYHIGCALLRKSWQTKDSNHEVICREVPYMWKYVITKLRCSENINTILPLVIQFSDEDVLGSFLGNFKYDTWDEAVQLLINLNKSKCINCDNKFETNCDIIKWTRFATAMVQSIGGSTALNILTRYSSFIPSHELDATFYQTCIFTTIMDNINPEIRYQTTKLVRSLRSNEETTFEFDKALGKFLQKKSIKKCYTKPITSIEKTDTKCTFCDLPFKIPILKNDLKLKCNHLFHEICLQYNKNVCNVCNK